MLKTEEEVKASLEQCLGELRKKEVMVRNAHVVALKLVKAGVSVEMNWGGDELLFKGGSEIARKICREFGVKFKKTPDHTLEHVDYDGKLDGVDIRLYGQLPPGCKIVYRDRVIPERTVKVSEVVCE